MPGPSSVSIGSAFFPGLPGAALGLTLIAAPANAQTISPAVNNQVFVTIARDAASSAYRPSFESKRTWTWSPAANGRVYISVPLRGPGGTKLRPRPAIW